MNIDLLNASADIWGRFVIASLWDGGIALTLCTAWWLLRRRWASPQVGCWLFLLVIIKIALPWHVPVEFVKPAWLSTQAEVLPPETNPRFTESRGSATVLPSSTQNAQLHPAIFWMAAWMLLASGALLRLFWIAARTRRIIRASHPIEDGDFGFAALKRLAGVPPSVQLRLSDRLVSPAVCGLFQPCVLLPRGLSETLSPAQLRWVLLHELFHIQRGDLWIALGQSILQALLIFHPVVWLAGREASALRERACDDAALSVAGISPRESADGLLRLVTWIAGRPFEAVPVLGLFTLRSKQQLKHRIMKLNDPSLHRAHRLGWTGRLAILCLAAAFIPGLRPTDLSAEDSAALHQRITELEQRIAEMEQGQGKAQRAERALAKNRLDARKRGTDDNRRYTREQQAEIESLYQVANTNWRSDEAKESLKKLLAKYDKANRTGCATLYMGQMSEGQERLDYLTRAVEKFSDCYYFDGCQVGGYGRYVLALTCWEAGDKDKARTLLDEIKTKYKDATDHKGHLMTDAVAAVENEFANPMP